jgi:hypothetical protein
MDVTHAHIHTVAELKIMVLCSCVYRRGQCHKSIIDTFLSFTGESKVANTSFPLVILSFRSHYFVLTFTVNIKMFKIT